MATNDLLPFSIGSGANNMTLADYLASAARGTGFQNGVADATVANRALRQTAFVAAMIGQFTANKSGQNTVDNGDIDTFEDNFASAISQMIIAAGTINLAYGVDTSITANTFTVATTPIFTVLSDGLIVEFTPANTNTITTPVINLNSIGPKNIVRNDGSSLASGEIVAGRKTLLAWDSTLSKFVLLTISKKYIDDLFSSVNTLIEAIDLSGYVQKAGDTMGGPLILFRHPLLDLEAATKYYASQRGAWDVVVESRKAAGTGDLSVSSGYNIRALNTIVRNTLGATLDGNKVVLPSGTYLMEWDSGGGKLSWNRADLFDGAGNLLYAGSWVFSYITDASSGYSLATGCAPEVTFSVPTEVCINHWCANAGVWFDNGLSVSGAANIGAKLRIRKIS